MTTLVDTNALIDAVTPLSPWRDWARRMLTQCGEREHLAINIVVLSELFAGGRDRAYLDAFTEAFGLLWADIPETAAEHAGAAQRAYRKAGGTRLKTLPDFLIGAHALAQGWTLLTRDGRVYRSYFPGLSLVTPETHPL